MKQKFLFETKFYQKSDKYLSNTQKLSFIFCNPKYTVVQYPALKEKLARTSLRFIRRSYGFPIRGQRTCTNGKTAKKKLWRLNYATK